jgi:hypothetical protein
MNGTYSGFGYVELPGGQEFYLKQYEEHWDCWLEHQKTDELGPFTSCGILCDRCAYVATLYPTHQEATPMTEYSLSDFETVKEYLEKKKAPAPPPAAPAPAAEAPKKAPKPKALTKAELEAKVLELQREVDRLKPMEKRLQELDKAYKKMYETNNINARRLKKIQDVFYGNQDYSDDE